MQILSFIFIVLLLLSPLFFWQYILQSFPNLEIYRRQFILGVGVGALTTLPLVYHDIWVLGDILQSVFFSFSYISGTFGGLGVFLRISLFFSIFFILGIGFLYYLRGSVSGYYIKSCFGLIALLGGFSILIYLVVALLGVGSGGQVVESGDFIFQGFAMIFGYYIIISLLEEGMKYLGNINIQSDITTYYKRIGYACVIGLGFAFFENILYSYFYFINSGSIEGLFQLIFFRSLFTVSVHILCAIFLTAGLYVFSEAKQQQKRAVLGLIVLGGLSIVSHAFFDIALEYGYMGIIFLYIFALYITFVSITEQEG